MLFYYCWFNAEHVLHSREWRMRRREGRTEVSRFLRAKRSRRRRPALRSPHPHHPQPAPTPLFSPRPPHACEFPAVFFFFLDRVTATWEHRESRLMTQCLSGRVGEHLGPLCPSDWHYRCVFFSFGVGGERGDGGVGRGENECAPLSSCNVWRRRRGRGKRLLK